MATDGISQLLDQIGLRANTYYAGPLCGMHDFGSGEGVGHLHVIRSGELRAAQSGHPDIHVREPTLLFYPRPLDHWLDIDASVTVDVLCASVRYEAGRENPLTQSFPPVLVIPFAALNHIDTTLASLFAEAAANAPGRQVMLDRLCDILLIQIVRFAIDQGFVQSGVLAGLAHRRLAPLLIDLLDDPRHAWTVARMAAHVHMSRNGFSREFAQIIGITPADFLTRVRIALAQRLLRKGRPVALVAGEVGYNSQPAFSRAFIREVGRSPSAWLKQMRATA